MQLELLDDSDEHAWMRPPDGRQDMLDLVAHDRADEAARRAARRKARPARVAAGQDAERV